MASSSQPRRVAGYPHVISTGPYDQGADVEIRMRIVGWCRARCQGEFLVRWTLRRQPESTDIMLEIHTKLLEDHVLAQMTWGGNTVE